MKKVSTVAAKQSRKISQQKLTIGLDLGDRSSWYCVLNQSGAAVLEQRASTDRGEPEKDDRLDAQTLGASGCVAATCAT